MSAQGLDVSNFQGNFDWGHAVQVVPDLKFGIYRLTQGLAGSGENSPDPYSVHNHAEIEAAKLARGAYHFLDPGLSGPAQAEYFVSTYQHLGLTPLDMLWLDTETKGSSPAATAACGVTFMHELDQLVPHNPRGVYTYIDFAREGYAAGLGNYDLWLAYPNISAPAEPPPWYGPMFKFWQWGTRDGTDADAFMGTDAEFEAWLHSFAPGKHHGPGPFRHELHQAMTLDELARHRHTSVEHLWRMMADHMKPADMAAIGGLELRPGWVYYTTNP